MSFVTVSAAAEKSAALSLLCQQRTNLSTTPLPPLIAASPTTAVICRCRRVVVCHGVGRRREERCSVAAVSAKNQSWSPVLVSLAGSTSFSGTSVKTPLVRDSSEVSATSGEPETVVIILALPVQRILFRVFDSARVHDVSSFVHVSLCNSLFQRVFPAPHAHCKFFLCIRTSICACARFSSLHSQSWRYKGGMPIKNVNMTGQGGNKLRSYILFKKEFGKEPYLLDITSAALRVSMTQLKSGN